MGAFAYNSRSVMFNIAYMSTVSYLPGFLIGSEILYYTQILSKISDDIVLIDERIR